MPELPDDDRVSKIQPLPPMPVPVASIAAPPVATIELPLEPPTVIVPELLALRPKPPSVTTSRLSKVKVALLLPVATSMPLAVAPMPTLESVTLVSPKS